MGIELQKTKSWVDDVTFENTVCELKSVLFNTSNKEENTSYELKVINVIPHLSKYPIWVVNDMRKHEKRYHKLKVTELILEDYSILRVNLRTYSGKKTYVDIQHLTRETSVEMNVEDFLQQINFNYDSKEIN